MRNQSKRHRYVCFLAFAALIGVGVTTWSIRGGALNLQPLPVVAKNVAAIAWTDRTPALVVSTDQSTALPTADTAKRRLARVLAGATRVRAVAFPSHLSLRVAERVELPLFDGRVVAGSITLVRDQAGGRRLAGGVLEAGGHFVLAQGPLGWSGMVFPAGDSQAYQLTTADDGGGLLVALPLGRVRCMALPPAPRYAAADVLSSASSGEALQTTGVPLLSSRPESEPVLFLDFDGATVNDPYWSPKTIVAASSGLSADAITQIWRRVAEDYRPFNINVTTDPALYAAARPIQRMRCIITTTSAWYGAVGGVAGVFAWRESGVDVLADDTPCWAFSDQNTFPEDIALAVSHEAGHTLGLEHDGLKNATGVTTAEYFDGHGSDVASWGPIMGAPYGQSIIQWSKGDYQVGSEQANNTEDDVSIIADIANHTGFATENRSSTLAEAGRLATSPDGLTVNFRGLIEAGGGESWLLVAAGAGALSLQLTADTANEPNAVNFDGALLLTKLDGSIVASVDTNGTRFPQLYTTVAAGVYVLRVRSVGEGSPTAGGYTSFGSIGRFNVTGTLEAPTLVAPIIGGTARKEGREGELLSYQIEAAGTGLSYTGDNLPAGLAITSSGLVTGTPLEGGAFTATVRATNANGTASRSVFFAIADASLAVALDAPTLVFITGGDRPWRTVAEIALPRGHSAARSGAVLDNWQTSWITTTLTGPGRLKWRWKVSSEKDYDFFSALLDANSLSSISGETDWAEQTLNVATGVHTMKWALKKDPYLSVGKDAAWLDDVRWDRGYELWAEAAGLSGPAAAPGFDGDGDGLTNLLEYGLNLSPKVNEALSQRLTVAPSTAPTALGALELTFDRPFGREDLRYTVEVSGNLIVWAAGHSYGTGIVNAVGLPTGEVSRTVLTGGFERICVRYNAGAGTTPRFIRLRIDRL